ncbi:4-coumarate--CoA ligase 1-like [Portunus trituberculatus]|uniref:4-coumarate--CoA ligase 1-like n=1 Tax=Portunus trituberculatus TaxID=210409 RepID=UPI001E1D02DC|nr:4-coumarate--CoA ligase 1-like [Portunus trituberculatus]
MVPRVCAGLIAAGVRAGDAVILLSPNTIEFPIAQLAIQLLPATCVAASPSSSLEVLAHVVKVSKARWAVVDESVLELVENVTTVVPDTLRKVWVIGSSSRNRPSFSRLMKTEWIAWPQQGGDSSFNPAKDVALMQFSSGTTDLPKCVMLTHCNVLTIYMQHKCLVENELKDEVVTEAQILSRVLLVIPLCHSYCSLIFIQTVHVGGCSVLMRKFSPDTFLHAIQKYKITFTPIVPHIIDFLVHTPLLEKYDISSLKSVMSATSPLAASTLQNFKARVNCRVRQGYGLTESCASVTQNHPAFGFKMGSVGRVLPYQEVKVVVPGSSVGLPPGEEGEVWVRSPGIMLGYAPVPGSAPSPPTLKEGGWLPTGDLGHCDHEGFLFITDRIKDVIKVKGFQVSSNEIADVLRGAEGVGEVVVIAVPSSRLGEVPRAYVVPLPGVPVPSPKALQDYVAARLPQHKHLAGGVQVVDAIPKNATGKVLKRCLREEYFKECENSHGGGGHDREEVTAFLQVNSNEA